MIEESNLSQIEYRGQSGITQTCLDALFDVLQCEREVGLAIIISGPVDNNCKAHALMLVLDETPKYLIRAGFASGYGGEGPHGFSTALGVLRSFDWEIKEVDVSRKIFKKVCGSGLTCSEVDKMLKSKPRFGEKIYNYIFDGDDDLKAEKYSCRFPLSIPLKIIDKRILDLIKVFWVDPDAALNRGYRRLEGIVKKRLNLSKQGVKLFSEAFQGKDSLLIWPGSDSENTGLANLFSGTYMGFRNSRAHNEEEKFDEKELVVEFLQLNQLFLLEAKAIPREKKSTS